MEEEKKTTIKFYGKNLSVTGKKIFRWAAIAAAAVIIVGVVMHVESPSFRANQALELGERYLAELDYERAIAEFQRALQLDPKNEKIAAAISIHIEEFLTEAYSYSVQGDYKMESQMALYVLMLEEDNEQGDALCKDAEIRELLDQAKQDFEDGRYGDAKEKYDEAVKLGAEASDVMPNLPICNAYMELSDLCEAGEWDKVAYYMDSKDFEIIAEMIKDPKPIFINMKIPIIIGKREESYYVIMGDLTEEQMSGNAIGVISSVNTYAIYTGSWSEYVPNGKGKLQIWYKNESVSEASVYNGIFANGTLDGEAALNVWVKVKEKQQIDFDISVSKGNVAVFATDGNGNSWICDAVEDGIYKIDNVAADDTTANYKAGVPGFGGSDEKVSVSFLDIIPPVLTCTWPLGEIFEVDFMRPERFLANGIAVQDNLDGNISSRIHYECTYREERYNAQKDGYEEIYVYSAADSAGNEGFLTVTYIKMPDCDKTYYKVESVE